MKNNPDNRSDNVNKIQKNISNTIQNMEAADEMISNASNPDTKEELDAKNKRRQSALDGMKREIKDEARNKKK